MTLQQELGLKKGFKSAEHEAVLNIYYTASCIKKKAGEFFRQFGLTDVQFNVLMLLYHQSGQKGGLSQAKISDMMLVNRANTTSLMDRMEKAGLVNRTPTKDRRFNIIKMTKKAEKLLAGIESVYAELVQQIITPISKNQQKDLIEILGKIRTRLL
ncbi:MAG: MarR family winged helix-turn-helix transcriptional regulator [Planctomycetota bacterium]|jgi:MarR family 2-MHQ and catechol resistance regulon transcriptional repressor